MKIKSEKLIYRRIGRLVLIAVAIVVFLPFFYSLPTVDENDCQSITCQGIDVKENTIKYKRFLSTIKKEHGVLVLGSSETNAFGNQNYHGLLNDYFDCGHKFSVLAGAGRTAHIFFPTLLNNKDLFKEMNVLYFINPTYWRESLNYFRNDYYDRYVSPFQVYKVKEELQDFGVYEDYTKQKEFSDIDIIGLYTKEFRQYYSVIREALVDNQSNQFSCVNQSKKTIDSVKVESLLNELDLERNISKDFFIKDDSKVFATILNSQFQLNALIGFNQICKKIGVNLTFVLGPYNGVYCNYYSPDLCDAHDKVVSEIKTFLDDSDLNYIDCSDLSEETGTFIDVQHHSKYAAWTIANRINAFYEKNN